MADAYDKSIYDRDYKDYAGQNLGLLLNDYGRSNIIQTPFGEAEVFLDLDFNDSYFDKLKVQGYDANGSEVVKS